MDKITTALATGGIVAAAAIPVDPWCQLGISGMLAMLLYVMITKHSSSIDDLSKTHNDCNIVLINKLDELKQTILDTNGVLRQTIADGQVESNEILKQALNLKTEPEAT